MPTATSNKLGTRSGTCCLLIQKREQATLWICWIYEYSTHLCQIHWTNVCVWQYVSHLVHIVREVVHAKGTHYSAPNAYDPGQQLDAQNWHAPQDRRLHLLTVHLCHQLLHTARRVRERSAPVMFVSMYLTYYNINYFSHFFFKKWQCTSEAAYSELSGDVFRLQLNRGFLENFKIPRTEDFYGKQTFGPVNPETLSKRLGHTVKRDM